MRKQILMASAALTLSVGLAGAQTAPNLDGLVNVNIQDVLRDIAVDLNVEENNIPVTLQVPISVAANVCGVDVNLLSAQLNTGDAQCTATTGSQQLTQIVQQEMSAGGATGGTDGSTGGTDGGTGGTDGSTGGTDGSTGGTDQGTDTKADKKSAKDCAPGHTDNAKAAAPGQQDGNAKAAAPGQKKKTGDC